MRGEVVDNSLCKKLSLIKPNCPGFKLERLLGTGAFSECWQATDELSGNVVAIKKVKLSAPLKSLPDEVNIWKNLMHPNILRLYDFCHDGDNDDNDEREKEREKYMYMISEYANGGELFRLVEHSCAGLQYSKAMEIFQQICQAVNYLHRDGITHRDLKLENVLLASSPKGEVIVKVADFGFATRFEQEESLNEWLGSPEYSAPEILLNRPYDPIKADCWSLGVILYALLAGYLPFSNVEDDCAGIADVERRIRYRVQNGIYTIPDTVNEKAKLTINKLLERNPKQRWDTGDILSNIFMIDVKNQPNREHLDLNATDLPPRTTHKTFEDASKWTMGKWSLPYKHANQTNCSPSPSPNPSLSFTSNHSL